MDKFGRQYKLTIDPNDGVPPIVIMLPFTIQFWLDRNIMASLNTLSIDIFNLSEATRTRIFQDRFDLSTYRTIKLEAGYSNLYLIFSGRIFRASSARSGTEIITRIEARDGQFDIHASQTFQTLQAGQTLGDVLKYLVGQFTNLKLGAIGDFPQIFNHPIALNGGTWNLLKNYSDGKIFIDNGKVYILKTNEVLDTPIIDIDASTGLLQTPRRDEGFLTITTLLEPSVRIKQLVNLKSSAQREYNGQYPVIGIRHEGIISAAICGQCNSTFSILHSSAFQNLTKVPLA